MDVLGLENGVVLGKNAYGNFTLAITFTVEFLA